VQNRFTAYLLIALKREKRDYMRSQSRVNTYEQLTDFQDVQYPDDKGTGDSSVCLMEDITLMQALSQLTAKDRYIFFERVLRGTGYNTLANRLNM